MFLDLYILCQTTRHLHLSDRHPGGRIAFSIERRLAATRTTGTRTGEQLT